jgi:hypothetical protein
VSVVLVVDRPGFNCIYLLQTCEIKKGFNYDPHNDDSDIGALLGTKPVLDDRVDGANVPQWMLRVYYHFHYVPACESVEEKKREKADAQCGVCLGKNMKKSLNDMCAGARHRVHQQCNGKDKICKKCQTEKQSSATEIATDQTAKEK